MTCSLRRFSASISCSGPAVPPGRSFLAAISASSPRLLLRAAGEHITRARRSPEHRCTAHIDLATAYLQDGKFAEGVEHAVNALDIIAVTQHADSRRRVENLFPMIKTSGIRAARDLRRKLMEIKAAS